MENYIMLNGNKIELTADQIKLIQDSQIIKNDKIKNYFNRVEDGELYYYMREDGEVDWAEENLDKTDDTLYSVGNYCSDETLMKQRVWHETLSRCLWRFSMINDGDKIDWENYNTEKYCVSCNNGKYMTDCVVANKFFEPYFYSEEIAQRAIDEIITPFVNEHPDFIW